jgi:hypothetical protein
MHRSHCWTVLAVVAAGWAVAHAQDRPADRFEVATVKPIPSDPNARFTVGIEMYPGGR